MKSLLVIQIRILYIYISSHCKEGMIFRSMDPLYPPGLDENRAVDDLYSAPVNCSETALLNRKKILVQRKIFCTLHLISLLHVTKRFPMQ